MAKKKKRNKSSSKLKHLANIALSLTLFLFIIGASYWWSGLKEEVSIELKFSETTILEIGTYRSLVSEVMQDSTKQDKIREITKRIEDHPYVKAARVSKHYPSQIRIEIMEREPIAIVNKDPMVLLDENGFVLPDLGNLNNHILPVMSNFNSDEEFYPHGKKALSVNIIECISLLSQLKEDYDGLYDNLSEIKMSASNEIELILADQPTHIFLGNQDIDSRINILKEFEKELRPKSISRYSYLDIRYNNQVIAKRRHS